jgi:fatty-acid desaturase
VVALLGCYVFGTLGINVGYHRLLAHRGFSCPRWVESILGVCCMQESPVVWVALLCLLSAESAQYCSLQFGP